MILEQIYLGCLSQASYLVGDPATGTAAVVDPRRDVDVYLERAVALGLRIRHVFLTHIHADFLAGHLELRNRVGADIRLGAAARADYPFVPMGDGEILRLGDVTLTVLETPGHTPESISIVVGDASGPRAVLTGDTLFVGDVGRPDLLASAGVTAEELAGRLYDSLHGKLLRLPDSVLVYPGHGAGSACGKSLSTETVSTIGEQRRSNYALRIGSKEEFVRSLTAGQPAAPRYFRHDADLNRRDRATLDEALARALTPRSAGEVLRLRNAGAELVDVREPADWARGHLADSLNIPLSGRFAPYAGSVVDPDSPIVLVAEPGTEREAAMRLGRIGYDRVVGFLEGGPASIPADALQVSAIVTREEVQARPRPAILDVRTPLEFASGHLDGAVNIPLALLPDRLTEVPWERPLLVVCRTGHRSSVAQSLLERAGFRDLENLQGGMEAWNASEVRA